MAPVYVDETAGSDSTGNGTEAQPYQTLAYAIFITASAEATYQIRKDPNTSYDEPTQSALKKAKKGADGLEKKKKKAEELAEREANEKGAEREKREKLLEESKKIVLEEDSSLPQATKVSVL
jgi:asparaginyl-tRNA synthetase